MKSYNFCEHSFKLIKSFLSNRQQTVFYNNKYSELVPVNCGVPQGSILGPLLFLIVTNDFISCIEFAEVVQFADDTTLLTSSGDHNDALLASADALSKARNWFSANELVMNNEKTVIKTITLNKMRYTDIDRSLKFLGLTIDETLIWEGQCDAVVKKLNSAIFLLRSLKQKTTIEVVRSAYFAVC